MALKHKKLHILFVDDDANLLGTTSQVLRKVGHAVTGRTGSLNGLRIFSEQPDEFDIAILDVTMADLTGLELALRFRRIQRGFPVILYGGDIDSSASDVRSKQVFPAARNLQQAVSLRPQ